MPAYLANPPILQSFNPLPNLRPPIRELSAVASISSRWSKFAQLVTDHVLGYEYRHMLPPVVNRKCVADHVRDDRGASTPRLDELLLVLPVQIGDLLQEMVIDKESFF